MVNELDMKAVKEVYCDTTEYDDEHDRKFEEAKRNLKSVAVQVLEAYNIPVGDYGGGKLAGIDIKHMDASSAIRMSLFESAAGYGEGSYGSFFLEELIMDNDGKAQFKAIGQYPGLDECEFYFTTQSQNYLIHETHVKVTGKKERPVRHIGEWKDLLHESNGGHIWDTSDMATSCYDTNRKRHATITFNDPHFDATSPVDGIESIYESADIWEQVIGWVWFVDPGELVHDDTTIKFVETGSSVPGHVGNSVGALKKRTYEEGLEGDYAACFEGLGDTAQCDEFNTTTVPIDIPDSLRYKTERGDEIDKFIKVSKVYIVAYKLGLCVGKPKTAIEAESGESTESSAKILVCIDDLVPTVYQLTEGIDYAFGVQTDISTGDDNEAANITRKLCLQFANNAYHADGARYGDNVEFTVLDASPAYRNDIEDKGILIQDNETKKYKTGKGTIFPKDDLTGFLIKEVWVQVELDVPGMIVEDPEGKAYDIADDLVVEIAPMLMYDKPAPIVIDGDLVDQAEGKQDNDPLTVQNLTETEYEKKLLEMDGGNSIELTMATLDEQQCIQLSDELYRIANDYTGQETTYMCTPGSEPVLGGFGNSNGIVNGITYSYSDQSSYTITVTEGAHLVGGLTGVTGGPAVVATEQVSANGHVIQDYGNGTLYKVLIDGLGPRDCISSIPSFIRIGDSVNVTIYNNPVETLD